jgi:hypothetical protein
MFKNSRHQKLKDWLQKKIDKTERRIKRAELEAKYQKQAHRAIEARTEEALRSWHEYLKLLKAGKAV